MEVTDDSSTIPPVEVQLLDNEPSDSEEAAITNFPIISLNAMLSTSDYSTMRLVDYIDRQRVHVLIGTGSTHNFLNSRVTKDLCIVVERISPLQISVAGGSSLMGSKQCKGLKWTTHGMEFDVDVLLLPLAGIDMVLIMQWLCELGIMQLDCKNLVMEFLWQGKPVKLTAISVSKNRVITEDKMLKLLQSESDAWVYQLIPHSGNGYCHCIVAAPDPTIPPLIASLLETYSPLFQEPTTLPPKHRGHDHCIIL